MILRPQSLESFKHYNNYPVQNSFDMRKKIENFTFLPSDKIGRGYSSIVYKGENQHTKQQVAIKVIQLKSLRDENTKRFLTNELECLRRLNHPNVLRYVNSFMTTNNCYIITQLYDGGDLAKLLKQKGTFTEEEAFNFFHQFYSGYSHFTLNGYIHRDIKPSNILIRLKNPNSKSPTNCKSEQVDFVIADFGFIKYHDQNPKDAFNVGTPVYMSPESITSNIYTTKSDVWSMGVMLYELVYGQLPFSSRSENDLKREICNKELKPQQIQTIKNISTSQQFKSFLLSCLRKNPQNRIAFEQIAHHPWFKKYLQKNQNKNNNDFLKLNQPSSYDLNVRTGNINCRINEISRIPIVNSPQDEQKYGYIGNLAVKRQKSLQANHFGLKNCYKNSPLANKQNIDVSIERHREKAKLLLGLLNQKNQSKNTEQYFVQNHQNLKLKLMNQNAAITDSPKIEILLQKKNGFEPRSSLLQGMKGVVNIKNNQILKINNYDLKLNKNPNNNINRRPSYQKQQKQLKMQVSTSLQSNKFDSQESKKEIQYQKSKSPVINSFNCLPIDTIQLKKTHTIIETQLTNRENLSFIGNTTMNLTYNFSSNQKLPSQHSVESIPTKKPVTNLHAQQYCLKLLHLLRYIYQILSLIHDYKGELSQNFNESKQILQNFFVKCFVKIKNAIFNKENLFRLEKWSKLIDSERYHNFVDVIRKYQTKYTESSIIGTRMKQYSQICDYLSFPSSQNLQANNLTLLKLAEQLSSTNKQTTKKSLRSSSSFNQAIVLIFNLQKCLQMIQKFIVQDQRSESFYKMCPDKDLQQMNGKNKDPFKIPKMIIQLKKKLIMIQSSSLIKQVRQNVTSRQKVGRPKRQFSSKRTSIIK